MTTSALGLLLLGLAGCAPTPTASPTTAPAAPTTAAAKPAPASPAAKAPSPAAPSPAVAASPMASPAAKPAAAASPSPAAAGEVTPQKLAGYKPDAPLSPPLTVKAGFFGVTPDGAYVLGMDRGYFQAEGITVETVRFPSSTDSLPALAQGDIDVYGASPNPALFNAIARGVEIRVLAPLSVTAPGFDPNGVIVRQDLIDSGRYKTLADLKGMKLAVGTAFSTSNYALKAAVEAGGLNYKEMDVSALGVPNILPALANKGIDAAATTEPSLTRAESQGLGKVVARLLDVASPEKSGAGNGIFVGSPAFLSKPGAERFMIAWVRSQLELQAALTSSNAQERDAVIKLLNDNGVNVVVGVQQGLFPRTASSTRAGLQTLLDWYREDGAVTVSVDISKMANDDLQTRAYRRLAAS